MYYLYVNIWLLARTQSLVLFTFTARLTKQHPVNISFLKKTVQRIIHCSHNRSCRLRIEIKHLLSCFIAEKNIRTRSGAPLWFKSYTPELVLIFYSVIKHGYRCFISFSFIIKGWHSKGGLYVFEGGNMLYFMLHKVYFTFNCMHFVTSFLAGNGDGICDN